MKTVSKLHRQVTCNETLWDELQENEALFLAQNPYNLTMLIEVYKGGLLLKI
jgi:hypothetical protein